MGFAASRSLNSRRLLLRLKADPALVGDRLKVSEFAPPATRDSRRSTLPDCRLKVSEFAPPATDCTGEYFYRKLRLKVSDSRRLLRTRFGLTAKCKIRLKVSEFAPPATSAYRPRDRK